MGRVSLIMKRQKDLELTNVMRDILEHDIRTSHLKLPIVVQGCVVHVSGEVGSDEERKLVRGRRSDSCEIF